MRRMVCWLNWMIAFSMVIASSGAVQGLRGNDGFRPLFNGKDLRGWVDVNCAASAPGRTATFTVKDGKIICTGLPTGVLRTDRMYENFIVECEWRHMKPGGNAGFFVWADPLPSLGVPFTRGVEVQVLDGPNGDWYTTHGDVFPIHGATMTPDNPGKAEGRAYPTEHLSKPSPQWNHYRIECIGGAIALAVNGKVVTRGRSASPRKGYICLESEGGVVEWRNLKIRELPSSKPAVKAEMTANAASTWKSLYSGVDLQGWAVEGPTPGFSASDWVLRCGGGEAVAKTIKEYFELDLMLDFKLSKPGTVEIGAGPAPVTLDAQTPGMKKPGEWNRVEIRMRTSGLLVTLNGVKGNEAVFRLDGKPRPIWLKSSVPTEFASLFVRTR